MLVTMPPASDWISHLSHRFDEAVAIDLVVPTAALSVESARVFVPNSLGQGRIGLSHPNHTLREVCGGDEPQGQGWVRREDLHAEAAAWLCEHCDDQRATVLVCGAGLTEVGDEWLENHPHVIHGGRPFLQVPLRSSEAEMVSTTLRWGRSWAGFLGIVSSSGEAGLPVTLPVGRGLFLCDAFDGDSLIVAGLT